METGTSNIIIGFQPDPQTGTSALSIVHTEPLVLHHGGMANDGAEPHCLCKDCQGREDILNKIWKEYCIFKDAEKWWEGLGHKTAIEMKAGVGPLKVLLMAYQDHLNRNLYDSKTGVPLPETDEDTGSDIVQ